MRMFAFLALGIMLLSLYSFPKENNSAIEMQAMNFLMYRDSVRNHVFKLDKIIPGVISDKDIAFPTGFMNKKWKAQIEKNILYIYGNATQQEINQVKKQTLYSHSVGQKKNGLFYPHYTKPPTILPNFIKEGDLVSIMEIVE